MNEASSSSRESILSSIVNDNAQEARKETEELTSMQEQETTKNADDVNVKVARVSMSPDGTRAHDASSSTTVENKGDAPLKEEEQDNDNNNDDEEEKEEPITLEDLMMFLNDLDAPGSTCAAGPATVLPSIPKLHVEGVGDISLPITKEQAKLLAAVAVQAPHGKGMETIVDTSVRNTLQIDPSKVSFKDPDWDYSIEILAEQAAEDLGVNPSLVRAEVYKLLLYEPGGFFKKHRDTEKAKGMFATLVVQLPSKFTGGSFVVSHGGKSDTFTMGVGDGAASECHYVCHYADCEHEINKIESGYRLAIVYSLCYKKSSSVSTPVAGSNIKIDHLSSMLNRLPRFNSLFVHPLGHQYTISSLSSLGAGALKGSDRAKQNAIEIAGKGNWKTVFAKVVRTDYYSGSEHYNLELVDDAKTLTHAYYADGTDASAETEWMEKLIDYESVEYRGMIMLPLDEMGKDGEEFWGFGADGRIEYTGNEGVNRETTYSTYIMIVYSEESGFERMCATNFSYAVSHAVKEGRLDLFRRLLEYIDQKKKYPPVSISNSECIKLLHAAGTLETTEIKKLAAFKIVVYALSRNRYAATSTEIADNLLSFVEQFGLACTIDPINAYATTLANQDTRNICDFITNMSFLLNIQTTPESMNDAVRIFETREKTYSHSKQSSSQAVFVALESFCCHHPREKTMPIVQACISRLWGDSGTDVDKLVEVVNILEKLRSFNNPEDIERLFHGVVKEFLAIVDKVLINDSSPTQHSYGWCGWRDRHILYNNNIDKLFRHLFELGGSNVITGVEQWAMKAQQLEQLSKFDAILDRVTSHASLTSTYCDDAATNDFVQAVKSRVKELKLSDLFTRYQKLLPATQIAPSGFSWSMPQANTPCEALTAFLKSPRSGPEELIVGGGINNARKLASGAHRYTIVANANQQGYSVRIEATSAMGKNAAIIVTKTSDYTNALAELSSLAAEIRKLGGSVPSYADVDVSDSVAPFREDNPAKKPRMEIIEID